MALAAFDTLEVVDELEKSGIPEKQARAISAVVRKAHESSDLATKQDIVDLRKDTQQDIADVRREISELRKDMDTKFELMNARFEKLLLRTAVVLGALSLVGPNLGTLLKLFH